jgi:arsenate reductase
LFPFALHVENWPFDDPAAFEGSEQARLEVFRDTRDRIDTRIKQWLAHTLEISN